MKIFNKLLLLFVGIPLLAAVFTTTKTVSTAGTAVQLATSNTWVRFVIVQSDYDNTGEVYVGGSDVSSDNGIILQPGDALAISLSRGNRVNLADLYVDASADGQKVIVLYER